MFLFLVCLWNDITQNMVKIIAKDSTIVPLTDMDIKAKVYGTTASIDFSLKYKNTKNDTLVESRLVFPMDADMALSDVVLKYDDKVFISEAMKRKEARIVYEEQKSEKHTALLVSKSDDLLSIDLCAIPPEKEITIVFTLYANLPVYFDALKEMFAVKFSLPTTLFPRYSLGSSSMTGDDDSKPLPVNIGQPKYNFHIRFEKQMEGTMECITKAAVVDNDKGVINVDGVPTDDFNVNIFIPNHPKTQYEIIGQSRVVNFKVNPVTFEQDRNDNTNKSIVFLLDCSGSMSFEDRMNNVKESMKLFLHSLPASTSFDIIRFGSRYDSLFNGLKQYDDETMKTAAEFIEKTYATMGGTEILNPMKHIMENYNPDIIILLTDGAVSDSSALTNYVKDFSTRIYALGVGSGADVNLVRNLARFTSGTFEHIVRSKDIQEAVIRLLGDAVSPFLKNMQLTSDCGTLMQLTPTSVGRNTILDLYYQGTFNESSSEFCHLTIKGKRDEENVTIELDSKDGTRLQNSKHLHAISIVRATNDDVIDPKKGFELAHKYTILTRQTSLILYDNETQHNETLSETSYVPVAHYQRNQAPIQLFQAKSVSFMRKIKAAPNVNDAMVNNIKVESIKMHSRSVRNFAAKPIGKASLKHQEYFEGGMNIEEEEVDDGIVDAFDKSPHYTTNTRSIGIETIGGIMTQIVARGESLPVSKTVTFNTAFDNQEEALIKVYDGERALAKNNHLLSTFLLKYIPPKKQGVVKINVKVDVSAEGIINIYTSICGMNISIVERIDDKDHFSEEKAKADEEAVKAHEDEEKKILESAEMFKLNGAPCIGTDYCAKLTNSQLASGEWHDIESIIRSLTGKTASEEPLLSAIVIVYLEKECSSSYSLLVQKGKRFLVSKYGKEKVDKMIEKARSYFQ